MGCNQSTDGQWAYPVNGTGMSNGSIDVSFLDNELKKSNYTLLKVNKNPINEIYFSAKYWSRGP